MMRSLAAERALHMVEHGMITAHDGAEIPMQVRLLLRMATTPIPWPWLPLSEAAWNLPG